MFRFGSIKTKFIAFVCLVILVPIGIIVAIMIDLHKRSFSKLEEINTSLLTGAIQEKWEEKVRTLTAFLAKEFTQPMHELDVAEMNYLSSLTMENDDVLYVYVQDKIGRVIADATNESKLLGKVLTGELTRKALAAEDLIIQRYANSVDIAAPILVGTKKLGIVRIGFSLAEIQESTALMKQEIGNNIDQEVMVTLRNTFLLIPAVLVSALIIGLYFARGLVLPIKELVWGTKKIANGDLTYRIVTESKDEIGQLAASFNDMTSHLMETKKQLQDHAENLEREVNDKTKEIRREKEYTEGLIETAQDAIICIDEKGIVNIWNRSAEKIFGYLKGDIIGKPVTTIMFERHKKEHNEGLMRFLSSGEGKIIGKTLEITGKTKDGDEVPIELSVSSQKIEKDRYTFTGIIRDITFQKEAKNQLIKKSKEIEKINEELKDFVYIVSHDLKEPLFTIEGYASRLSKLNKDTFEEKGKRYIDRIKANTELMSKRIYEILEVVKIGMVMYDFKENDIGSIVRNVVKPIESKINENKINLVIQENLPVVLCDEKRIKDVFSNLITNAIKFMDDDKQREIRVGYNKDGHNYKFFIEDTGIGIRPEFQEQIFGIFRRLKDIEVEGTGVGLAIVKKIVEIHNGNIWVESPIENEKGSRFCFTIPIKKVS